MLLPLCLPPDILGELVDAADLFFNPSALSICLSFFFFFFKFLTADSVFNLASSHLYRPKV